jgi:hypothetical protein
MLNDFIPSLYAFDETTVFTVSKFIPIIAKIGFGFKNSKYTIDFSVSKNIWVLNGKLIW